MKYKNDIHAPVEFQKPFRLYGIWTMKIKISKTLLILFDEFLK